MLQATCPSCMLSRGFSLRSPIISGTPNGHDVALVQCEVCGFAALAYFTSDDRQILHHFPREVRCMSCETALHR